MVLMLTLNPILKPCGRVTSGMQQLPLPLDALACGVCGPNDLPIVLGFLITCEL